MSHLTLLQKEDKTLINLKEASIWASQYLNRKVTPSNISYLLQYGRIKRYGSNGNPLINIKELRGYYDSFNKEKQWKKILGEDIDWHLSFVEYKEAERTKHVHRLHPYKGKFIPQLVEYFLDSHTDEFKKEAYFHKGDIVLDPFCGSGTTLVQANELGIHAIGIDISSFNAMITNVKVEKHNLPLISEAVRKLTLKLKDFQQTRNNIIFEEHLLSELAKFNSKYFPSPEYKRKVRSGIINESKYSKDKEKEFLAIYNDLIEKYQIKIKQDKNDTFLEKWFLSTVREEIDFLFKELKAMDNKDIKKVLSVILSRTVRSCRATTHADLGGVISKAQRFEIDNIILDLRNKERKPDYEKDMQIILKASSKDGKQQKEGRIVDLYMVRNGVEYLFEIKTVKPNIDIFTKSKTKLLEWIARRRKPVKAILAFPYNPYFPEPYKRFTEQNLMQEGVDFLVGEDYWNFLGGKNTFVDLLNIFNNVGKKWKNEILIKIEQVAKDRMENF